MSTPAVSSQELASGWDGIADQMGMWPAFYEFVAAAADSAGITPTMDVADVGCGNGSLVELLSKRGFKNLTAVDFSPRAIEIVSRRQPGVSTLVHDISECPLPSQFEAIFFTEVIEHVVDPLVTLEYLNRSLSPNGYLILSFPNRAAYGPLVWLRWISRLVRCSPRLFHWVTWFTMPYEMRTKQPLDHSYSSSEVAQFLGRAGFRVIHREGFLMLPMLHIPGVGWLRFLLDRVEGFASRTSITCWYYRVTYVCQSDTTPTGDSA